MVKIYKAIVIEPTPDTPTPRIITATSEVTLQIQIRLRINHLQQVIKRKLPLALIFFSCHFCCVIIAAHLSPAHLLPLTALAIIYLKFTPLPYNPIAEIYYSWRYIKMWRVESERRNAVDAKIGLRH